MPVRAVARYALAILLVTLALMISLALEHSFGNPFWFFFSVAVILSTWFGRTGPGWLSVVCSTLAVMYYFTPPSSQLCRIGQRFALLCHIRRLRSRLHPVDFMAQAN